MMVTVILRRNFEFSLQLSAFLSTQGFRSILRFMTARSKFSMQLNYFAVMKSPPTFCFQQAPKNVKC
jgi:hypothetical protein